MRVLRFPVPPPLLCRTMRTQVASAMVSASLLVAGEGRSEVVQHVTRFCVQGDGNDRRHSTAAESRAPPRSGSLRLLYDETNEMELQRAARDAQLSDMRKSSRRNTTLGALG